MKITVERKKKKKKEWSKVVTGLTILAGFVIAQECFVLMYLAIRTGYDAAAAWLTAAVGLAEAVIGTALASYISLCKKDHSKDGITYAKAQAKNFEEESI